ncbi:MAG TPA: phosphatidylglycerophosphatase A [Woeseiaceae bacterium]|nr:phosphatidylglycerophosphatase A [Woeseiaceae bacterium]
MSAGGAHVAAGEVRAKVLRDPVLFVAFGFGSGLAPAAPGTVGSALGVLVACAMAGAAFEWRMFAGAILLAAGFLLCGTAARRIGVRDHSGIVLDEIAAMYLVLLFVPPSVLLWTLGFALFRLFDIWKPWPIRDLDHRLSGSAGIMLDDLAAALYAALILRFGGWLMV